MESSFVISAASPKQFPEHSYPEIALMGKSNCGKSSLVNALLQRKKLAYRSSTPGSTVMINFYRVTAGQKETFMVADLPGYGYSKTKKSVSQGWDKLMDSFFNRNSLQKVLFLLDIRRDFEEFEKKYLRYLSKLDLQIQIVLTKNDKVKKTDITRKIRELKAQVKGEKNFDKITVCSVSTLKKSGIKELQEFMFFKYDNGM